MRFYLGCLLIYYPINKEFGVAKQPTVKLPLPTMFDDVECSVYGTDQHQRGQVPTLTTDNQMVVLAERSNSYSNLATCA